MSTRHVGQLASMRNSLDTLPFHFFPRFLTPIMKGKLFHILSAIELQEMAFGML